MAFVGKSALATGSTSATPVYASAVAGNLLVALCTVSDGTPVSMTLSGATTGWTQREAVAATSCEVEIWDKIAVGSDTMPTWNEASGTDFAVIVAEFSSTTTFDKGGTLAGTTSPATVTASAADGGTGRLIVAVRKIRTSSTVTATFTDNVNSLGVGVGINVLGDDGSTSQVGHHHSLYVTTATTGSVADNDVATWSVTSTRVGLAIASYAPAAVVARNPLRLRVIGQAVNRAAVI